MSTDRFDISNQNLEKVVKKQLSEFSGGWLEWEVKIECEYWDCRIVATGLIVGDCGIMFEKKIIYPLEFGKREPEYEIKLACWNIVEFFSDKVSREFVKNKDWSEFTQEVYGNKCTCHERDSSYTCSYCKSQDCYGHMEKKPE